MSEHGEFMSYYNLYADKIFTFILYRVNFNRAVAEDLTQEIFIKAFTKFETYDRTRQFSAWIFTIARNHLLNYYRDRKEEYELSEIHASPYNAADRLDVKMESEALLARIREMEPYSRDVLLMRYVDGLSHGEIAEVLGKEEGAVRTQLSRALKKLKAEAMDSKSG